MPLVNYSVGEGDVEDTPPFLQIPQDGTLRGRIDKLDKHFSSVFGGDPVFYVRVPGRVNLIGEHIDYCGYSVCPMAIQQDIIVAARPSQSVFLHICNLEVDKYQDCIVENASFSIDVSTGWTSYVLCGVRGVLQQLPEGAEPLGMLVAVSGNIPPGSGLSSSSALVSAAALAMATINSLRLSKVELATLSAKSECYIGTVGGGMDQAIAFLGSEGCAKLIEFSPLRTQDVQLPAGAVFVIAHSLAVKNKAESSEYNTRVVECRLATQILAKQLNKNWKESQSLGEFQKAVGIGLDKMVALVTDTLHENPYTKEEICGELSITEDELNQLSLTANTQHIRQFHLRQRALHVFQEARRVEAWVDACKAGSDLVSLGQLMSASHDSLQHLYQCSHPDLDSLVQLAMDAGALGARLTGAGWGGCVVALTTVDKVSDFILMLKKQFYASKELQVDLDYLIFASEPSQGAQVFLPHI